jgi:pyrimidine deaminase RibD-like protein
MKVPDKKRFSIGRRVLVGMGMLPGTVKSVADVPSVMGEFVHEVLLDGKTETRKVVGCEIYPIPDLDADLRNVNPPTQPEQLASERSTNVADDHRKFARLAIDEARKSVSEPDGRPHPLVGAVVVKNGQVLSVAHRGEAPGNHAEFIALEKKLPDEVVAGASVYTTLEPCTTRNHPKIPCVQRIVERKVTRVVIGMLDPDERITGRGQRKLRSAGIITELFPHDLMAEVEELNREFTRHCERLTAPMLIADELQKRFDLIHVSARIDQGTEYLRLALTNESDEEVRVTEVVLLSERGVRLTEPHLLKERNTIEGRKWINVEWRTQPNPANKLVSLRPGKGDFFGALPNEFETELEVSVTCEALGKVKPCKTRLHVKVDSWNHNIEQIAG